MIHRRKRLSDTSRKHPNQKALQFRCRNPHPIRHISFSNLSLFGQLYTKDSWIRFYPRILFVVSKFEKLNLLDTVDKSSMPLI